MLKRKRLKNAGQKPRVFYKRLANPIFLIPNINSPAPGEYAVFVNPLIYFAQVRFGFNHFAFYARYRVNDQFKRSDNFYAIGTVPELPRLAIGLEIALYE